MTNWLSTRTRTAATIAAMGIALAVLIGGCAAHKATSAWRSDEIIADGSESEWPGIPQFYDNGKKTSIRLMHDAGRIYICFATNDRQLKQTLAGQGVSVWFDPDGGKNKVIGIHLPGRGRFRGARKTDADAGRPSREPALQMPATVDMTYSETTGPLKMDLDEVRRTGIEIGVGQPDGSRYVYEFIVPFAVDEALSAMGSRQVIGVGITAGDGRADKPRQKSSRGGMGGHDGGRGGGSGGRAGRGGGKIGGGKPSDPYEVWLTVQLACSDRINS